MSAILPAELTSTRSLRSDEKVSSHVSIKMHREPNTADKTDTLPGAPWLVYLLIERPDNSERRNIEHFAHWDQAAACFFERCRSTGLNVDFEFYAICEG